MTTLNKEQKNTELHRHREILLAALDYLLEKFTGCMVVDGEDHIADHYRNQKLQVEKYFKQRQLDRMQQKLVSVTTGPDKQELTSKKQKSPPPMACV